MEIPEFSRIIRYYVALDSSRNHAQSPDFCCNLRKYSTKFIKIFLNLYYYHIAALATVDNIGLFAINILRLEPFGKYSYADAPQPEQ